jgi:NAD(P)-dependent dehydrogenase (short-subunit alcohol dehydrogenase family)
MAMKIDLDGLSVLLAAKPGAMRDALAGVLAANGASIATTQAAEGLAAATPDRFVIIHALRPDQAAEDYDPLQLTLAIGKAMSGCGAGRIIHLFGVWAMLPMRRYAAASVRAAALVAGLRAAAMALAPKVLVNGIAVGAVVDADGDLIAGDATMPGHSALGRPGRIADVAGALLFLADPRNTYTTGQVIVVDGGWSTGYARNF